MHLLGAFPVASGMAVHKDGVWTHLGGSAQRHGGMDAELTRFIGGRGNYAALVPLSAHDNGFALQRGIRKLFHGHEKCVHVDVEYGLHSGGHGGSRAGRNCISEESVPPRMLGTRYALRAARTCRAFS